MTVNVAEDRQREAVSATEESKVCVCVWLRATKVVSHSSVALWYAFNNPFSIYKVTFAFYEMF